MRNLFYLLICASLFLSCNESPKTTVVLESSKDLANFFENYYQRRMELYPVESTINGETDYNDRLPAEFTDSYREKISDFFRLYLNAVNRFNRDSLNEVDQTSY